MIEYIYIAVTALLWSGMEVALKSLGGAFNPVQLTMSRVFVGGLILLPLAVRTMKRRGVRLDRKAWRTLIGLSLVGVTFSINVTQLAIVYIPATAVSAMASTNPMFTAFLSWLLLHERLKRHQTVGLLLALAGLLFLTTPWNVRMDPWGVVFGLLSPLSFSLYSVFGKRACRDYGAVAVTCLCFLLGAVEMAALSGLSHIPALAEALRGAGLHTFAAIPFFYGYSLKLLPVVLYIFVGGTGIGFACYFLAIEAGSAQKATVVFFVKPVLAPILAMLLLRETVSGSTLIGLLFIIVAAACMVVPELIAQHNEKGTI